jgi:DNA modification methylase
VIDLRCGDSVRLLAALPAGTVRTCVTSPPYFGLRDYGHAGQIGLEPTPDAYVARMVEVFRAVRRVLADDGTLWLNLGDSYSSTGETGRHDGHGPNRTLGKVQAARKDRRLKYEYSLGSKQLLGIPWRVAFALQADGWILRSDIIWHKPNPMPESVRDRPTKSHEYLFVLSKGPRYFYDADAVAEPAIYAGKSVKTNGAAGMEHFGDGMRTRAGFARGIIIGPKRNRRSVWTVATRPYKGAHFAVFPPKLIEPCILAGSAPGDTVLDPFCGSGTTLAVAEQHGRSGIGFDLNPEYLKLARRRLASVTPGLALA